MEIKNRRVSHLEAFAMNNGGARLIILLHGDPHLLEGGERSKDGPTNPHGVFALRGSDNLNYISGGSKTRQFLMHPISDSRKHRGASRYQHILVQVFTDIGITLRDGVVNDLVDSIGIIAQE